MDNDDFEKRRDIYIREQFEIAQSGADKIMEFLASDKVKLNLGQALDALMIVLFSYTEGEINAVVSMDKKGKWNIHVKGQEVHNVNQESKLH